MMQISYILTINELIILSFIFVLFTVISSYLTAVFTLTAIFINYNKQGRVLSFDVLSMVGLIITCIFLGCIFLSISCVLYLLSRLDANMRQTIFNIRSVKNFDIILYGLIEIGFIVCLTWLIIFIMHATPQIQIPIYYVYSYIIYSVFISCTTVIITQTRKNLYYYNVPI